jgi:hypothetical protein
MGILNKSAQGSKVELNLIKPAFSGGGLSEFVPPNKQN